jgi:hypothetical protein
MKAKGPAGAGVMKGAVRRDPGAAGKIGKATGKPRKANISMAAMERRQQRVAKDAILARREKADMWSDELAFRSGQYPKSPKKRSDFAARATKAEANRRQNSLATAQRATEFYKDAAFSAGNFSGRSRFTTQSESNRRPLPLMTSYFSAWRGYSYKPSKPKQK